MLEDAKYRLLCDSCFWGTDSMIYGQAFADRNIRESETRLRDVANAIVQGDYIFQ